MVELRPLFRRHNALPAPPARSVTDPATIRAYTARWRSRVTGFFREADTFEFLKRNVLPRIAKHRSRDEPIRAWVAGCSTGEEAYSLAIMLVEFFEDQGSRRAIQIFGTDVNDAAVQKARAGVYSDASTSEIPPARLQRFFTPVDGHQQVVKRIRDLCVFARQDLTKDPP
jgi:two-component system, chemotaxis family, CheB/CheR fusion protein